ncbi:MAG: hypothetical protein JXJ17_17390 [Anaerolineae bacterium]|nr:hypothetical protein [Anaerolineae bacterium]
MEHSTEDTADSSWRALMRTGGIASFLQLGCILAIFVVFSMLGTKPVTAEEAFTLFQGGRLTGIIQNELFSLLIIGLCLFSFTGVYAAFRRSKDEGFAVLLTVLIFIAVTITFANQSTFSLMHLSDRYAAAATDIERSQLLAAGEAVIASDIWDSTGGYMVGILLQGAGVAMSLLMLRHSGFRKVTAYSGLIANALDLIQHLLHPFMAASTIPGTILMAAGPFYIVWYIMLGLDLLKLGRKSVEVTV